MAASGDWVTPRLYGEPWFEKPILYYWVAALGFRTPLSSEAASRLPSALAALLTLLAIAWCAAQFYGENAAWAVALIFATCIGSLAFARAATPDMLFTAALAGAMTAAAAVLRRNGALREGEESRSGDGRRAFRELIFFGGWIGVASLAKGPAALALAGGSIALWALATRQWRAALRLAGPIAIISFCVVAFPWYVLCALRNSGFVHTFLFLHNFERYLTPVFQHRQPFWFFIPVLLLGLLPWTALLAGVALDGFRGCREENWQNSPGFFFACWAIFPVVFFSFSQSKLPGYALPVIPPLALLLAAGITRGLNKNSRTAQWLSVAVGATWVAMLALPFGPWLKRLSPEAQHAVTSHILTWAGVAAAGGLLIVSLGYARHVWAALAVSGLLFAGLVEVANLRFLPQLDPYLSARTAAEASVSSLESPASLSAFRLERDWRYQLNFYLGRELPEWAAQPGGPAWVFTNAAGLAELEHEQARILFLEKLSPEILLVRVEAGPH